MYNGRECLFQLVFSVQPIEFNLFLIMHLKNQPVLISLWLSTEGTSPPRERHEHHSTISVRPCIIHPIPIPAYCISSLEKNTEDRWIARSSSCIDRR